VNSTAGESVNGYEPIHKIFPIVVPRTDQVFKVIDLKVKVTETFSGRDIPIDSSPSTFIYSLI